MLCFAPPLPADLPQRPPERASAPRGHGVTVLIVAIVLCALLLPFGWAAKPRQAASLPGGHGQGISARVLLR